MNVYYKENYSHKAHMSMANNGWKVPAYKMNGEAVNALRHYVDNHFERIIFTYHAMEQLADRDILLFANEVQDMVKHFKDYLVEFQCNGNHRCGLLLRKTWDNSSDIVVYVGCNGSVVSAYLNDKDKIHANRVTKYDKGSDVMVRELKFLELVH